MEAQVRASHASRFQRVREAALDQFATLLHHTLASRSVLPSTIRVHRVALGGLVFPVLPRTHEEIFACVLGLLSKKDLLKGKTIGVDGTTLDANAALRSIVRRDDFRSYQEVLTHLAQASGIPTPTREDLARIDRKRRKKGSNLEWVNPHEPDAQITKMKNGSTHLSHKQEHAVDMESGAVVAVTLHGGSEGDTSTIEKTLDAADQNLKKARKLGDKTKTSPRRPSATRVTTSRL